MPGNLSGRTDGRTDMPFNGDGWSGGPTDPSTGQKRLFQASDGRTDGQPENIMPPAPKGGGITNKTRQHSTQSVKNMPPPSPRHLLPHVLQIMPRNANYDQFQPKGHHNEENPQSMTKMPGNPKFYLFHLVKIASKLEKSTNCNHNLINSESGQDTSACKISGHFLDGFSRKCLETLNLTRFI